MGHCMDSCDAVYYVFINCIGCEIEIVGSVCGQTQRRRKITKSVDAVGFGIEHSLAAYSFLVGSECRVKVEVY